MISALLAGLVAGYGIAIPVGAVGTFIVALSARTSLRVGVAAGLGAATADGLYALVAVLAGVSVARLIAPIAGALQIVAGLGLLALAAFGAVTAVRRHRAAHPAADPRHRWTPLRAYLTVVGITVLNPSTVVYFVALVLGGTAGVGATAATGAVFVVAVLAASASWQLLLAGGGVVLGRWLTGPRGQLATALASSVIITALAVSVMVR